MVKAEVEEDKAMVQPILEGEGMHKRYVNGLGDAVDGRLRPCWIVTAVRRRQQVALDGAVDGFDT